MAGHDGYDAELVALRGGASDLVGAAVDVLECGRRDAAAADAAAGGVLGGALAAALAAFGERLEAHGLDLFHGIDAASQAVENCALTYEADDAAATSRMMATTAAMTEVAPNLAGLYTAPFTPAPAPTGPPLPVPGLDAP